MICTFKFSFDEDVLAFLFGLATVLANFYKLWANFSQSSGHPVCVVTLGHQSSVLLCFTITRT